MPALRYGSYTVELFTEPGCRSVVYTVSDPQSASEVWTLVKGHALALAAVSGVDWNRELSPWHSPKAFRGGEDFGGQGLDFLHIMTAALVPLVEQRLGFVPESRMIAGYSLAGLFALWSVFHTDIFEQAASISGSLWFDGFLEHMEANAPAVQRVYLSLGDKERATRNPRMASVEERTRQAAGLLRAQGIPVTFELNQGGHFQDVPIRIARGINALLTL